MSRISASRTQTRRVSCFRLALCLDKPFERHKRVLKQELRSMNVSVPPVSSQHRNYHDNASHVLSGLPRVP